MSYLTFDLSVILGSICIDVSFYNSLIGSTLTLAVIVALIFVGSRTGVPSRATMLSMVRSGRSGSSKLARTMNEQESSNKYLRRVSIYVGVYILLFAYPPIASRLVQALGCHSVEGVKYLRVDYTVRCDSDEWRNMAIYASVWICVYVIGFPLYIFYELCVYSKRIAAGGDSEKFLLGFLLWDYKPHFPMLLWESIEMQRKLWLSTVGAFWPSKGTMSIATAFIISIFFLALHLVYHPFKSKICNQLQVS
jgi:hypothetical protein